MVLGQLALTDKLTHLALDDLEITNHKNNNTNVASSEQKGQLPSVMASLALQEVVAVFLRLESDQVTLETLLETLATRVLGKTILRHNYG